MNISNYKNILKKKIYKKVAKHSLIDMYEAEYKYYKIIIYKTII